MKRDWVLVRVSAVIIQLLLLAIPLYSNEKLDEFMHKASELFSSFPDSSNKYCKSLQEQALKEKNEIYFAYGLICEVRYLVLTSSLTEASEKLDEAIIILHKKEDYQGLGDAHTYYANIMGRISHFEESLYHEHKAIYYYNLTGDTAGKVSVYTNTALYFIEAQLYDSAFYYLSEIEKFSETIPFQESYYIHQNWGYFYLKSGDPNKALLRLNMAYEIADSLDMHDSKSSCKLLIGRALIMAGEFTKAKQALESSIQIAKENNLKMEEMESLEGFVMFYERQSNISEAFKYYRKVVVLRDSMYNNETVNRINRYEKRMALLQKQSVIDKQQLEIESERVLVDKSNSINNLLITLLTIVLCGMALGTWAYVRNHRLKQLVIRQKRVVEEKSAVLEDAYTSIHDSITYASNIQQAILTDQEYISKLFPKHSLLYKPRDIVSGDFYWCHEVSGQKVVTVADCTGHGVPGAFMSVLGTTLLREIVADKGITMPSRILEMLRAQIIDALSKKSGASVNSDGMDMVICTIENNNDGPVVSYSGGNNPLWIIADKNRNDLAAYCELNGSVTQDTFSDSELALFEVKGDKQPVGNFIWKREFKNHVLPLRKGDYLVLMSDGYADQFGGPNGKKFKYSQLKKQLLEICREPVESHSQKLDAQLETWQGDLDQIDDICVLGIQLE